MVKSTMAAQPRCPLGEFRITFAGDLGIESLFGERRREGEAAEEESEQDGVGEVGRRLCLPKTPSRVASNSGWRWR